MLNTVIAIILLPLAVLAILVIAFMIGAACFIGKAFTYGGRGLKAFAEGMEAKARIHRQEAKRKEDETYVEYDITDAR